jgi:hypothetical protein
MKLRNSRRVGFSPFSPALVDARGRAHKGRMAGGSLGLTPHPVAPKWSGARDANLDLDLAGLHFLKEPASE